jgi:predicted PurR-regulated permease PerM
MVMYTLYFAAAIIMPIVLTFLLSLVFAPVVRFLVALHIPRVLGALVVMLLVATAMGAGLYAVVAPATAWMEKAPAELRQLESKLAWVKEPLEQINEARRQVGQLTGIEGSSDDTSGEGRQPSFSLFDTVLSRTPNLLFGIFVLLILLFFVLASGDSLLNKLVQSTPRLRDKMRVVASAREIQQHVSVYLATISFINLAVGVVVALSMHLLGMPNAVLWGAMVGVLNYIPYLGVAVSMAIVGFVSMLTFDTVGMILLPPAVLLAINIVEGQMITPMVTGRRLALSPMAVFLWIVVLGWLWGIVGALVATPVLATIKLITEKIESLEGVAIFLSHDEQAVWRPVRHVTPP